MNIQQLRSLCAVVDADFNITKAARELHATQPGISQQISALEKELGTVLFERAHRRFTGLTRAGEAVVERARSAILDISYIRNYSRRSQDDGEAHLVIATTHTQARYTLPEPLKRFAERHPAVKLTLNQRRRGEVSASLLSGEAHIGVMANAQPPDSNIVPLECRKYERLVIVAAKHPLLRLRQVTLEDIACYPLITYEPTMRVRDQILEPFEKAGIAYNVVIGAIDADVLKRCVEVGLGVTILPTFAYDVGRDKGLRAVKVTGLFPPCVTAIWINRRRRLSPYALAFIQTLAPQWKPRDVERLAG